MEQTDFKAQRKNSLKRIVQVWEVNLGDLRKLEGEYHFSYFDITLF